MLLANLTKREYVDLKKVSKYLFQKIFFALLWGGDFNHPQFGRWAGDQVVVVADYDITSVKATRLMRSGKLNIPDSIFKTLEENGGWDHLSRLVLREFKDITEEVVSSFRFTDPYEAMDFDMLLDLILEDRKKMLFI